MELSPGGVPGRAGVRYRFGMYPDGSAGDPANAQPQYNPTTPMPTPAPPALPGYQQQPAYPQSAPPAHPQSAPPAYPQTPAYPQSSPPAVVPQSGPPGYQPAVAPQPTSDLVPVTDPAASYGSDGTAPYGSEQTLVQIGQITVTATTVHTPNGSFPLRGSQWVVNDHVYTTQKIATWAIVCAIVGFFCLTVFSLLFLLFKETKHSGFMEVAVSGANGSGFVTQVPISSQAGSAQVHQQVNYARSLAMR